MAKTIKLHGRDYIVINPNTERARNLWRKFQGSTDVTLNDAYGRYSKAKENAYNYCRDREREFNSYNGVITGHNTSIFSYAFTGMGDNFKQYLIYITYHGDYAVEIGE